MTQDTKKQTPARLNWRVDEFCQAFGIGKTKFYRLVKDGKINPIKCGRTTLISAKEINRFQLEVEAGNV